MNDDWTPFDFPSSPESKPVTSQHQINFTMTWDFGISYMGSINEVDKIVKEYQELIPLIIKRNLLEKQAHEVHQQILKLNQKGC